MIAADAAAAAPAVPSSAAAAAPAAPAAVSAAAPAAPATAAVPAACAPAPAVLSTIRAHPDRPDSSAAGRRGRGRLGVAVWAGVVAIALAWGTLAVADSGVKLRAAPLYGRWAWHAGWGLLPAAALGTGVVVWGPMVWSRVSWRIAPALAGATAAAWTVALAAADGWGHVTAPLATRHGYEAFAAGIGHVGGFLAHFTQRLDRYPVHVQGHPPGPVILPWALDRSGLAGAGWLAALSIAGWGGAVAAVLVAVRAVVGEAAARRAAPALVVLPAAVWAGTSADGLFAGIAAAALALVAVAAARASPAFALAAGAVSGVALLCTYGAAPFVAVGVVVVAVVAGRPMPVLVAFVAGVLVPLALAGVAGFWWPEGLAATGHAYWAGIARDRPAAYLTLVGNPAALALATGPAVAAGLATSLDVGFGRSRGPATGLAGGLRRPAGRAALLPGAVLAALVLVDLSQLARGEVERIWLPFVPWLAVVAPGHRQVWLAAQVSLALALQAALVSPW